MTRILVVEDNPSLAALVCAALTGDRYAVDLALSAAAGLARALTPLYDVIVIERGLRDSDGVDLVRQIRKAEVSAQVLMLAASSSTEEQIAGLDAGSDDYLAEPFAVTELLARVRALARRQRRFDAAKDPTKHTWPDPGPHEERLPH